MAHKQVMLVAKTKEAQVVKKLDASSAPDKPNTFSFNKTARQGLSMEIRT